MKRIILLVITFGILLVGANAFALDSNIPQGGITVNGGHDAIFSFSGITSNFSNATLTLTMGGKGNWGDHIDLMINGKPMSFSNNGVNPSQLVFTFNNSNGLLGLLNQSISHQTVAFDILHGTGKSTIYAATLTDHVQGPHAPEPVSMALMGAGIVALPFARRLKNIFKKEA